MSVRDLDHVVLAIFSNQNHACHREKMTILTKTNCFTWPTFLMTLKKLRIAVNDKLL